MLGREFACRTEDDVVAYIKELRKSHSSLHRQRILN